MNFMNEYKLSREVSVMEGIDFKKNKERYRKAIENKKKKEKKLHRRLNAAIAISAILLVVLLGILYNNLGKSAMDSCQANGNSYDYCMENI